MNRFVSEEHVADALGDLQTHGRCLALELRSVGVSYDTIVHSTGDPIPFEGWEIPAGTIPADRPLMLGMEGIYLSDESRVVGREVRPINEREVARHGAALAIREKLIALEKKHAIFDKIKEGRKTPYPKTGVK